MVGCFCHMVKAGVSDNFDYTEDVDMLQSCLFFSWGFWGFL